MITMKKILKIFSNITQARRAASAVNGKVVFPISPARGYRVMLPDGTWLSKTDHAPNISREKNSEIAANAGDAFDSYCRSFS